VYVRVWEYDVPGDQAPALGVSKQAAWERFSGED
jgi:hypothetical protein